MSQEGETNDVSGDDRSGADPPDALTYIGKLIDSSEDQGECQGLEEALRLLERFREKEPGLQDVALSFYFESNAWEALRRIRRVGESRWGWEQDEYERSILALRRARGLGLLTDLNPIRQAQIATNLANALSHVGRIVEALELWQAAMEIVPRFPMALGNHGRGLVYLAERTHDPGHQFLLARQGYFDLRGAVEAEPHPIAKDGFAELADRISQRLSEDRLKQEIELNQHSLGSDSAEVEYREWVLAERLFLNPLNQLGTYSIAAVDPMMLPGITQPISEGPYYLGFFNQMKQEFASARYAFYRGISDTRPHFSDRGVKLVDTLDYPVYSKNLEAVKDSFRVAYGLFDKIAFFVNHYFDLGIPDTKVTFRTIWYRKRQRKRGLRDDLEPRRNIALQALFWLGKDLFEDSEGFREALEPDAQQISEIRNHLEHKYLKVHGPEWSPEAPPVVSMADTLAYSLRRDDFEQKALRLLKMARAGLVYLTQAAFLEERRRTQGDGPVFPMELDDYDDDLKA